MVAGYEFLRPEPLGQFFLDNPRGLRALIQDKSPEIRVQIQIHIELFQQGHNLVTKILILIKNPTIIHSLHEDVNSLCIIFQIRLGFGRVPIIELARLEQIFDILG